MPKVLARGVNAVPKSASSHRRLKGKLRLQNCTSKSSTR